MKHILVLLTIVGLSLGACQKETLNDEFKSTDNLLFESEFSTDKSDSPIEIDLWRKSNNCFGGLGICKVRIGPWIIYKKNGNLEAPSRTIVTTITEEGSQKVILLKLASKPEGFTQEELKFYIDDDVQAEDEDTELIIPAGIYNYNHEIGSHGGYKIIVK